MEIRHLTILVLILVLAGCIGAADRPVLEFSSTACNQEIEPYTPPEAGILETIWENETTLRVNGFIKTYCGGAEISGDYQIWGDSLTLLYNVTTPGPVTSCLCTRGMRYRIMGLRRAGYGIALEKR